MNQVIDCMSTTDRRVIAEYVGRMQNEYERLQKHESSSGLIQSSDDPADYQNTQIVAAWDGKSTLQEAAFFRVRCRVLNANGLSFWMAERPTAPFFVLIVESAGKKVKLKARVTDVTADTSNRQNQFVVETEFEGTV